MITNYLICFEPLSLIQNKKAYFDYEILEKIEAGIELLGFEVKSLKAGQGSLLGSHVTIRGNEAFMIGVNIPPYQVANTPKDYNSLRNRKRENVLVKWVCAEICKQKCVLNILF